jgi:hypothetical protein
MRFLKAALWFLLGLAGLFLIFLVFSAIDDYRPHPEELEYTSVNPDIISDSTFSVMTWNLGYGGLDSSMDFFYDGGKQVRPKKDQVKENIEGILRTLGNLHGLDFYLLQEVDLLAKRSYRNNIYQKIADEFSDYHTSFAKNYDVAFVPLPPAKPMGRVVSGLQTLSVYTPKEVKRISFPGNYSWPVSMYMLDRCFMVNRHMLENGKELIMINTHNSAYDDGSLRTQQMNFLKEFLLEEYAAGNYIVVGGDWNQSPTGFKPKFAEDIFDEVDLTYIPENFPASNWNWAYDPEYPTNRRLKKPYKEGETPTTLIDFFLLSPNLEVLYVHGIDLNFIFSDHQPEILKFKIK